MKIIPAIDLKDGKCVRLREGKMDQETIFSEDPVATASHWFPDMGGFSRECERILAPNGLVATSIHSPARIACPKWTVVSSRWSTEYGSIDSIALEMVSTMYRRPITSCVCACEPRKCGVFAMFISGMLCFAKSG